MQRGGSEWESNLSRFAGVSEAGACRRNPEPQAKDLGLTRLPPVLKLRRLAGVSEPAKGGEREPAAEILSAVEGTLMAEASGSRT